MFILVQMNEFMADKKSENVHITTHLGAGDELNGWARELRFEPCDVNKLGYEKYVSSSMEGNL